MKRLLGQLIIFVPVLCLINPGQILAGTQEFADLQLQLGKDDTSLLLDGDLSFHFSEAALEALANGLPLAVDTEIEIRQGDKWYWQKSLASYSYKLEIQYHALSQQYLVKGFGYTYPKAFYTQSSALTALGRIEGFPLIDLQSLDPDSAYEVNVRTVLDSESLPIPLRPLTYISDEWRMRSDWKRLNWPMGN
jgi:hypothetical protein